MNVTLTKEEIEVLKNAATALKNLTRKMKKKDTLVDDSTLDLVDEIQNALWEFEEASEEF